MKEFLKRFLPSGLIKTLRPWYHGFIASWASWWFGRPSEKMLVIGVTGTNGKTTTVNLIARILEEAGLKTGFTSTAVLNIDGQEHLNKMKMTMPSGWVLQKWMKQMLDRGCKCAVLEVSSEGLAQNRHLGINFDVAVFTNLTPEHLEAHGGFENYKLAKSKLFEVLSHLPAKKHPLPRIESGASSNPPPVVPSAGLRTTLSEIEEVGSTPGEGRLQKTIITNADDENGKYYSSFKAEKYITYGVNNQSDFQSTDVTYLSSGVSFIIHNSKFILHLKGQFDVYNSLAAIATAQALGISLETCKLALEKILVVPGRVEVIQEQPFTVVVDYAYEPEEMRQLYETISRWKYKKIIQVLGPTGGGRDSWRIPVLGKMAGEKADTIFLTTDDPYDDDPKVLAEYMAKGVTEAGKNLNESFFIILDRKEAFRKAFKMAGPGDLVLITGKGADQKMALAHGKYLDWDDRKVAKEELGYLYLQSTKQFGQRLV